MYQTSTFLISNLADFYISWFTVAESPGGSAYGRELKSPDWVLDYWSHDEKAQYPEYFARREELKKEYIAYWEKKFGKVEEPHHH